MSEAVMFVDDEENILNSIRRIFRKQDYEIVTCLSAEEALKILETKEVQVLITDQVMPGMKGTDLLKIVKNKYPAMIRIILSAYSEMEDIIKAINQGEMYRFLKKPEDLVDLIQVVERALEQSRLAKKVQHLFQLLQEQASEMTHYSFQTSYSGGFIKVELNAQNQILNQKQLIGILSNIVNQIDGDQDLDFIGGILARQKGKMLLLADLTSGYKLVLELPIEEKNE